ncbi:MAG: DUF6318 family protein, partial [Mycobacteriales bacterium]
QLKLPRSKAGWRQGWWWRERLPTLLCVVALVFAVVVPLGVVWALHHGDSDHDGSGGGFPGSGSQVSRSAGPVRPTESPPTLPDVAHTQTTEGIKATVRFEIAAINYAQRTGDLEPAKSVYNLNSCKSCKLLVEKLSKYFSEYGTYADADYSINSIEAGSFPDDQGNITKFAQVYLEQLKNPQLIDKKGKISSEISRMPKSQFFYNFEFIGGNWIIQEIKPGAKNET